MPDYAQARYIAGCPIIGCDWQRDVTPVPEVWITYPGGATALHKATMTAIGKAASDHMLEHAPEELVQTVEGLLGELAQYSQLAEALRQAQPTPG